MSHYRLYLDTPAIDAATDGWENATPVGNGKLGAMLYGGIEQEILQLNEERIWAGKKRPVSAPGFYEKFQSLRTRLLRGEIAGADAAAEQLLAPYFGRVSSYETAGELRLAFDTAPLPYTKYSRVLDLLHGVATVSYQQGETTYTRTLFASYPRGVIVLCLESDRPAAISLTARYTRPVGLRSVRVQNDTMYVDGETSDALHPFSVALQFTPSGGTLQSNPDGSLSIRHADRLVITIAIATHAQAALPTLPSYEALKSEHEADFSAIMRRADVCFDESDPTLDILPVPARLTRLRRGEQDPGLINLYFQFGRYLLLSSSRGSSLPANLQGVWNRDISAPWGSDYHTNVNLQMNYWHAEVANLAECTLPLFHYMHTSLLPGGQAVAKEYYRCSGTVVHHLSDIYGFAAPADGLWGLWQTGAAWLCYPFWEHYLFSPDLDFLRTTAYPFIAECTRFFLDFLVEAPDGTLQSGPSTSPENRYFLDTDQGRVAAYLCLSPTMDVEIIRGLFDMCIRCEELLHEDNDLLQRTKQAIRKLPPLRIGKHGQLMEWQQDYDEPEPGHRHVSHCFALYPDCHINRTTPALMQAMATTLHRRLSHGGGHTGWSCAWLINLFARLGDGTGAQAMLQKLLCSSTKDNLFDSHPPFQIDGNFGGAAGIAEMLLQSHDGTLTLLPALPDTGALCNGSFSGLRARGGITVDAAFRNGSVYTCTLKAERSCTLCLRTGGREYTVSLTGGKPITLALS